MENDMDLILGFTQEARDYLDEVEPALIELSESDSDEGGDDAELINGVFRLFHSMKGSAGFLQLNTVASLTHEAETLLEKIRRGKAKFSHEVTQLLCQTLDLFREMLDAIEANGNDSGFDDQAGQMCARLVSAHSGTTVNPGTDAVSIAKPAGNTTSAAPAQKEVVPGKSSSAAAGGKSPEDPAPEVRLVEITDEMRKGFVLEGNEQIDLSEQALLVLENDESSVAEKHEALNEAFRNIHSFKGNCGFMGFADLETLSHKMETSLDCMREKTNAPSAGNIGILLSLVDVLRDVLNSIGNGSNGQVTSLEVYLELMGDMLPDEEVAAPSVLNENEDIPAEAAVVEVVAEPAVQIDAVEVVKDVEMPPKAEVAAVAAVVEQEPDKQVAQCVSALEAEDADKQAVIQKSTDRARRAVRQDIRVDLNKLDTLINLVGELVIAEAMVTRCPAVEEIDDEYYYRAKHQLRRICDELQDVAMAVRMIPLSGVFRKMIRLVHDLSHKAEKKIKLTILGEETEVDKTVIEQIGDPLVHIIRNSCDHGIETPHERLAAGKPEVGNITLEGRHEGGEVWILITDDGRGLNRERILKRAIERGLVKGDGSELSDERVYHMIFEPGFSTAEKITDISGRGVGMDVVKKNIEKLNGRVDIRSTLGRGSTMILRIPLTLAIIDGMLVRIGDTKYTIPVLSIRESLRPSRKLITSTPDGQEFLRLRDEMIPVVRLYRLFNRKCDSVCLEDGILVIAEDSGVSVALFIDEIVGQQQTVIKGLSDFIGKARGCSGCTILGDGSVSLILDINSICLMAEEFSGLSEEEQEQIARKAAEVAESQQDNDFEEVAVSVE